MSPIFKCLICRKDIERSTKTFWIKKGHLLCSTCLDNIDKDKKNLDNIKVWGSNVKNKLKSTKLISLVNFNYDYFYLDYLTEKGSFVA